MKTVDSRKCTHAGHEYIEEKIKSDIREEIIKKL